MNKRKPMSNISFRMMSLIMSTRALFRDTTGEVARAGVGEGDRVLDYGCGTVAVSTGLGPKAYAGGAIEGASLEQLARESGLFSLQINTQGFHIFTKA